MRILVVDDKQMHRESARETLADHELTIVSSFDEVMDYLVEKIDEEKRSRLLAEAGLADKKDSKDEAERKIYWEKYKELRAQCVIPFGFDAVLTDMMMPMSRRTLGPGIYNPDEQVPYGFVIALKAAARGAKLVALVTDVNHHQGAMSAAIDHLYEVAVNGAKALFLHARFVEDVVSDAPCESCNGSGRDRYEVCWRCKGAKVLAEQKVYKRKDWGAALRTLLE